MAITSTQIDTMINNCMAAFFDSNNPPNVVNAPRIAPGDDSSTRFGRRRDSISMGPWWMNADVLRLMVERCRAFPNDTQMIARVKQQAAYWSDPRFYSEAQLQSDGSNDGTVNLSDDASWKMLSFCDLHRITGDGAWLTRATAALPKILNRFKDPYHAQITSSDGLAWSPYGVLYATPGNTPANISTTYEVGLVLAAIYIYQQTGKTGFLNYAAYMAKRFLNSNTASNSTVGFGGLTGPGFQDTTENPGAFFVELYLNTDPVQPNIRFAPPKDPADGKDHPFRNGGSPHMIQASFGVATVCAQLYRIQKDTSWLQPIKQIVSALASPSIYLPTAGKFLNDRDPYEAGFWACDFVRDVLSLRTEAVDPSDTVRTAFVTTGQYILSNPISGSSPDSNTYYSADWGIPTDYRNGSSVNGTTSWTQNGTNNPGDQAIGQQMMTTSMSGLMTIAGYLCGTLTGATLTEGSSTLTDGGQSLVDA